MSDIASIGQGGVGPLTRPETTTPVGGATARVADDAATGGRAGDRVELSDQARLLNQLRSLPPVREGLVDRVRSEIADEAYLTDAKLDVAIDRLLEDLVG